MQILGVGLLKVAWVDLGLAHLIFFKQFECESK